MFSSALKSLSSNISANYQISPNPAVLSGPWRIHDGKKKSTGHAASIFIFDRKILDSRASGFGARSSSSSMRKVHDEVVERLKKEASSLARLRHPSILQILEPVEETRNGGLMFATEPITTSLSGLLHDKDGQEGVDGNHGRASRHASGGAQGRRDFEIDELEIQKGLLQIGKGLEFLHESAGLVHGNLTPDAIYINAKSDWKISGLGFAIPPDTSGSQPSIPSISEILYQDPRLPRSVQLDLDYTSPDFVLDSNVTASADLFSLGLVIVALYNSPHTSPLRAHASTTTYKKLLGSSSTIPSQGNNFLSAKPLPKDLLSHVLPKLLTRRPAQRISAREFQQSHYFDNVLVSTIRFLESLPAKTPNEKSQFMRGLPRILSEFPESVLEKKVLVALLEEMKDRELLSLILQNVFKIIKALPPGRRTFAEKVIPRLKEVFVGAGGKPTAQERDSSKDAGLMVVLENMSTIAANCSGLEFKDDILPLIHLGMESPTHSLMDAALKCLPVMLPVLDFSTVKNDVFPPIAAVFSKTSSLAIKVRGLEAFVVLCGGSVANQSGPDDELSGITHEGRSPKPSATSILDRYTIQEKVVPLLRATRTKEPAVMMAALDVFRQVGQIADSEFLALEVLPIMWRFSLGPLLNLQQFGSYMDLIKTLSTRVENEQRRKLQELASSSETTDFRSTTASPFGANSDFAGGSNREEVNSDFERLVLGRPDAPKPSNNQWDDWSSTPSSNNVSKGVTSPTFSWSTANHRHNDGPSAVTSVSSQNSRSITPDPNMSSFPALSPANTPGASMGPSFPSSHRPTASASGPSSFGAQPISGSNTSLAALASMRSTNTSSAMQSQQHNPNASMFTIAPPPPSGFQSNSSTGAYGALSSPGQGQVNSNFPQQWGSNIGKNAFQNGTTGQSTAQEKRGLDKYESLI
ncbi:hypothetical protein FQN54_002208 [Arachnomyces sp. PD_36]|nr:hypothetical protein FQN54_002208 [Arachnomyces sp. PD_36]